ncbi:MAG TPA: hypothetical protein VMW38_10605 [Terriglobia bacterium]|nr:hypothetical protein [Terriglobia bacterium]
MTIPRILCFLALLLSAGCSTTHIVPRDPGSIGFITTKARLEGEAVVVKRIEGDDITLDLLSIQTDTLVGYSRARQESVKVPLSDVDEITANHPMRGAGRGLLLGIAGGCIIGGLFDQIDWPLLPFSEHLPHDHDNLKVGVIEGGLLGMIVGASSYSTEHYLLGEERFERLTNDTLTRQENYGLEGLSPSEVITLKSWPIHEETSEAISILWGGKPVWLPKSRIKFERLRGGLINLAVPKSLMEAP